MDTHRRWHVSFYMQAKIQCGRAIKRNTQLSLLRLFIISVQVPDFMINDVQPNQFVHLLVRAVLLFTYAERHCMQAHAACLHIVNQNVMRCVNVIMTNRQLTLSITVQSVQYLRVLGAATAVNQILPFLANSFGVGLHKMGRPKGAMWLTAHIPPIRTCTAQQLSS